MALTLATGGAWQRLVSSVPGFRPAAEHDVVLVGVRALESSERDRLRSSGVTVIRGGSGPGNPPFEEVERAVDRLADRVDGIYLHVDLDAIDPLFGRANSLAVPGGLSSDDVRALAVAVRRRCPILGTSFTAYDPRCDSRFAKTALEVVLTIAEIV
jgi:arginase family enzyme